MVYYFFVFFVFLVFLVSSLATLLNTLFGALECAISAFARFFILFIFSFFFIFFYFPFSIAIFSTVFFLFPPSFLLPITSCSPYHTPATLHPSPYSTPSTAASLISHLPHPCFISPPFRSCLTMSYAAASSAMPNPMRSLTPNTRPVRTVSRRACLNCRERKIKCDGIEVCRNCKQLNLDCVFVKSHRGGRRNRNRPPDLQPAAATGALLTQDNANNTPAHSNRLPIPGVPLPSIPRAAGLGNTSPTNPATTNTPSAQPTIAALSAPISTQISSPAPATALPPPPAPLPTSMSTPQCGLQPSARYSPPSQFAHSPAISTPPFPFAPSSAAAPFEPRRPSEVHLSTHPSPFPYYGGLEQPAPPTHPYPVEYPTPVPQPYHERKYSILPLALNEDQPAKRLKRESPDSPETSRDAVIDRMYEPCLITDLLTV